MEYPTCGHRHLQADAPRAGCGGRRQVRVTVALPRPGPAASRPASPESGQDRDGSTRPLGIGVQLDREFADIAIRELPGQPSRAAAPADAPSRIEGLVAPDDTDRGSAVHAPKDELDRRLARLTHWANAANLGRIDVTIVEAFTTRVG